LLRNL